MYREHLQSHADGNKTFYTDGSKTKDGVGMSIVEYDGGTPRNSEAHRLLNLASIFTAELYAILLAITRSETASSNSITIISNLKKSPI